MPVNLVTYQSILTSVVVLEPQAFILVGIALIGGILGGYFEAKNSTTNTCATS